jgi:hypothetical protein
MKIPRLDYDPASALAFYEESLTALGALCDRTWHDRLELAAEGRTATLWNEDGTLHAQELLFAPADATSARDAGHEVFPGCPLTFRLAELLRPVPLVLEKVVLSDAVHSQVPDRLVLEKLWRAQYPTTRQWRLAAELKPCFHFSLVAVVRCEIQAIDQHWSLHRIAIALPSGEPDELLSRHVTLLECDSQGTEPVPWPRVDPLRWWLLLHKQIEADIGPDLERVRDRQQQYLQREIRRIDEYFAQYEEELARRISRGSAATSAKSGERFTAARAEHARRRFDQVARHEIRVQSHVDALLLAAERAWQVLLQVDEQRTVQEMPATFVPRSRRWFRAPV